MENQMKKIVLCMLTSAMIMGSAQAENVSNNGSVKAYGVIDQSGNAAMAPLYATSATLVLGQDVNGIAAGIKYSF